LSNESKMTVRSKMADQNQIFSHNSESIQFFFQSSFCIHLVLLRRKFCGKKVFQKIQDDGWNKKTRLI
jgi:hypothetical protein